MCLLGLLFISSGQQQNEYKSGETLGTEQITFFDQDLCFKVLVRELHVMFLSFENSNKLYFNFNFSIRSGESNLLL